MTDGTLIPTGSTQMDTIEATTSTVSLSEETRSPFIVDQQSETDCNSAKSFVGRSGKKYKVHPTELENLRIRDDQVCLLSTQSAEGENVLWVGSGQSLVHDQPNRAEFLDVVNKAEKAYIIAIENIAEQNLISWDLTNTHHQLPHAA
ncbi:hypothetical protein [Maritalea mediterranea]|uniref:DUF4376 domain-containing protein n=1 Tax=Maritalea mediterranea TaxID=2909667 RepID=A0ABS9ECC4_9HYPH|nr:hypothetical protein [Maritalea mediterranea]MCF4099405.1 hypothetical protein [Maritalea mediterranea]